LYIRWCIIRPKYNQYGEIFACRFLNIFLLTHTKFFQNTPECDFNKHKCDLYIHECDIFMQSMMFTRSEQKLWFQHARVCFLHAVLFPQLEWDFYKQSVILTHECDSNTYECDFNTHNSDFYPQIAIFTCRVWFTHIPECNFDTYEYDYDTQGAIPTRSVMLTRTNVITTFTTVISTRTTMSSTCKMWFCNVWLWFWH
jgi:hypothetical protein